MANKKDYILFDKDTQAFIYNMQTNAVQRMLDFDYVAGRKTPSVAAIVNPTGNDSFQKFFFGPKEILVPVYKSLKNAANRHKNVDVMINFASFRSAASSTEEAFAIPQSAPSSSSQKVFRNAGCGVDYESKTTQQDHHRPCDRRWNSPWRIQDRQHRWDH